MELKKVTQKELIKNWNEFFTIEIRSLYYNGKINGSDALDRVIQDIVEDFYMYMQFSYDIREGIHEFKEFISKKVDFIRLDYKMFKVEKRIREIEGDFE